MWLDILLLIGGIAGVYFGANWLVDGASSVARKLKVSSMVIGLTVVAFGTSAPELTVSVISAVNGNSGIAIGNAVGSNILNILLILGLSAAIFPLHLQKITVWRDIPMSLVAAVVLLFCMNDAWIDGGSANMISRTEGMILLCFFAIFLYYTFTSAHHMYQEDTKVKERKWLVSVLLILAGLAGLFFGGKFLVSGASSLAIAAGMSESVVGLTIVAFGTSVPELATSLVAAYRKEHDMAVGNVVGSNVFNIFFILGTSATITPMKVSAGSNVDMSLLIAATLILFVSAFTLGKRRIDRSEGIVFILIYIAYVAYLIINDSSHA